MKENFLIFKNAFIYIFITHGFKINKGVTSVYYVCKKVGENEAILDRLGSIKWDTGWRQYVFNPANETKWSEGCMENILKFIKIINSDQKQNAKARRIQSI
jgi:hypothetical protein